MKKSYKIVLSVLVLAIVSGVAYCNPLKVTDPFDPKFNPQEFRYSDYKTPLETANVFKVMFPIGTQKHIVDEILIGSGKAVITHEVLFNQEQPIYRWVRYNEPFLGNFNIDPRMQIFLFDENDKVININIWGAGYLYKNQPTEEDLMRAKRLPK